MTPKQFYEFGDCVIQDLGFWKKGFSAVGDDGKVTISNNGPCYGECGNGERFRTQGVPKRMKELEYAHVMMVGTGANYALYVIRDTTEEDQEELEEYDVLTKLISSILSRTCGVDCRLHFNIMPACYFYYPGSDYME